jgi:twitching motility protein PilT
VHVITIEDPIEFLFAPGKGLVIQREVGSDTTSYADALRAALRQDPDVLMVGELRDRASADVCLRAAEMGHLVIASMHTQDVLASIERFLGLFSPQEQDSVRARLAEHLQAVLCLHLVIRSDTTGLLPAVEALLATAAVREAIRDGGPRLRDLEPYMAAAEAELGMQPLDHHLERLWAEKRISVETALGAARDRAELERRIAGRGGRTA